MTKTEIEGNEKFTIKCGLRNLIGLIVEASEFAKDCGQFHVFGNFLQYFF